MRPNSGLCGKWCASNDLRKCFRKAFHKISGAGLNFPSRANTFDAKLGVGISVLASVGQNYRHSEKFHFETSLPPIPYTSPTLFAPTCLANSCPMHPSGPGMVQRVLKGGQKRSV
eukprot:scaffold77878_cov19-Tisochrysis_lutea.AAC.1